MPWVDKDANKPECSYMEKSAFGRLFGISNKVGAVIPHDLASPLLIS